MTFIDNEYFLIITSKKDTNILQFSSELPDDYEIIVKIQTPPQYDSQIVRLLLVRDNENNVRIGYYTSLRGGFQYRNSEIYFTKTLRSEHSEIAKEIDKLLQDAPLYLKLIKRGIEYTGAYSTDGSTWFHIGTPVFLNLDGKPAIEAYNAPGVFSRDKPPES